MSEDKNKQKTTEAPEANTEQNAERAAQEAERIMTEAYNNTQALKNMLGGIDGMASALTGVLSEVGNGLINLLPFAKRDDFFFQFLVAGMTGTVSKIIADRDRLKIDFDKLGKELFEAKTHAEQLTNWNGQLQDQASELVRMADEFKTAYNKLLEEHEQLKKQTKSLKRKVKTNGDEPVVEDKPKRKRKGEIVLEEPVPLTDELKKSAKKKLAEAGVDLEDEDGIDEPDDPAEDAEENEEEKA